ncbi:unnamed protein product [Clavelina lepadiformis]|uniref:SEFIR domain-containing protein n=1 Tax=Clavelina lepadiformis TaxID=159417 RepID=A0ABP0H330_CLALP
MLKECICVILLLTNVYFTLVICYELCPKACSSLLLYKNTGYRSSVDIPCTMEDQSEKSRPCPVISSSATLSANQTVDSSWSLCLDRTRNLKRIMLTFSWNFNVNYNLGKLCGYHIRAQKAGLIEGSNVSCWLSRTALYALSFSAPENFRAQLQYTCFELPNKTDLIAPGEEFQFNIQSIPRQENKLQNWHLKSNILLPDCSYAEIQGLPQCNYSGSVQINCESKTYSLEYQVPYFKSYLNAVIFIWESDADFYRIDNLPLSGTVANQTFPKAFDSKNYSFQITATLNDDKIFSLYRSKKISIDFCKCKLSQHQSFLPLISVIVIAFVMIVTAIFCWKKQNAKENTRLPNGENDVCDVTDFSELLDEPNREDEQIRLFVLFENDNGPHQNVVLQFVNFLVEDLGFDVICELFTNEERYCSNMEWMLRSLNEVDKILVIWSPKVVQASQKINNDEMRQDSFIPVLNHIQKDLFYDNNRSKYYFSYFDYCTEEDLPSFFQQPFLKHFKLMQEMEDLYFLLKNQAKYQPGIEVRAYQASFEQYHTHESNKHGKNLRNAIFEMYVYMNSSPEAKSSYCSKSSGKFVGPSTSLEDTKCMVGVKLLDIIPPPCIQPKIQKFKTKTDSYNATETSLQAYQHIPESDANSEGESGGSGKKFRGTPLPAIKEESNFTAMNKVFL